MNKNLLQLLYLSAIVYFIQGFEGIPGSTLFFYFKETLHLSPSTIMYLGAITGLAWLIKPVIGYLIDSSKSKKKWMMVSTLISMAICLLMGLTPFLALVPMVFLMAFANWNTAVRDVANDGMMCIEGKKEKATGMIQSTQWIAITVASILTGVGGGWLAEHYNYQTSYLILIPFYALLLWMITKYKENSYPTKHENPLVVCQQLFKDKNLLLVCLFIFLYNFAPSFGTPLSFIMRDEFHWSKLWMGTLGTIGSICSILGALLYYKFSKHIDLKKGLTWSVFIGSLTTLCYLYFTPVSCVVYDVINSVIGMFIQLMMLDFVARETKKGMEAISFALFCSIINLASTSDSLIGGWLFPIIGLKWLIVIAAFTSFLCLPLINRIKFK